MNGRGGFGRPISFLGAEAREFEPEEPERQENRRYEGGTHDAGDVLEPGEAHHRRVPGIDEEKNEREDRDGFGQADPHGFSTNRAGRRLQMREFHPGKPPVRAKLSRNRQRFDAILRPGLNDLDALPARKNRLSRLGSAVLAAMETATVYLALT